MKNANNLSILIWANKSKADAKGLVPLYARITLLGKRAEISTNLKVHAEKWNPKIGFLNGNGLDSKRTNSEIINIVNAITKAYDDLKRMNEFITADKIKSAYHGEEKQPRKLI
ncbi:MAG: Arm DNA-binding domain-containing protein, partial [Bacteroidota bacterium]|nr:Arm DNA-binding domain-containing protein [Bacteroidota bacterium]